MTMNDEKKHKSTIIRRSKKHGRVFNKELRQSVHELTASLSDFNLESHQTERPAGGLKRSRSFYKDEHVQVSAQNSREILKQYVVNLQINDVDTESTDSDIKSESESELTNNNNLDNLTDENPIFQFIDDGNLKDLTVYLIKNENIDIEHRNNDGQTPLIYSVCLGLTDIAKLLITSGADVTAKDNFEVSALRYAVEEGDFEVASLLISKGANAASVENGF